MKSYLFIDPVCPKPYTGDSINGGGLGGTEATVIRVAEGLGNSVVMQHNRTTPHQGKIPYVGPDWTVGADVTVVLRCPYTALAARQRVKRGPVYLWLHDLCNAPYAGQMQALHDREIEIICVSQYHKFQILDTIRQHAPTAQVPKIHVIYPPIEGGLVPDPNIRVIPNKLMFFSSPHKGLAYALDTFKTLRQEHSPDLELFIANPGYFPIPPIDNPGVTVLGSLPRADLLRHVQQAAFIWYPNHVFPETFGLVFAESNALGTPVITHPLGSAREVLEHNEQIVDTRDRKKLFDLANAWLGGNRPTVTANPKFRLAEVLKKWQSL